MGGGVVAGAGWDGAWTIGAGSEGRGAGATSRGAIGGGVRARASAPRGGTAPPGFSRGKPRVPPEGASGFRDDDRARVGWRATRARASEGVARAANVPPDRRGAPGRVAILRASRRGARDRRGWSRAARAPRHRTAPRRASRGAPFRATRASPPRPVPRAPSSSCSRDGPSRVPRSVERGARGIARGALRGSAAHAGRRASLLPSSAPHEPSSPWKMRYFARLWAQKKTENRGERTRNRPSNRSSVVVVRSPHHTGGEQIPTTQGAAVALSPSVLSTFTTTPRRARTPRRPRPSRAITPRLVRGAFQPSKETPGRPPNPSLL